jgi:poly-gamma-glutamate capsule biosynthesis protein CapA/YwtB (metallophosphatase superfamily)
MNAEKVLPRFFLILFITCFFPFLIYCQNTNDSIINPSEKELSLIFIGDIMQHDLQIQSAYKPETKKYDFSSQFKYLKPIFDTTDIVVGNLEVTLGGTPYKGYPCFSSPDELAYAIKNAGISYLGTANNHMYDKGKEGFERTMHILDSLEFKRTGTFIDQEDKMNNHPMIITKKGFNIAIFNYTYGLNGNILLKPNLINFVQKDSIIKDLKSIKQSGFDAVIVFFHWGTEYERQPNAEQIKLANLCFENGADIIIGSHPHVVQRMEQKTYKSTNGEEKDILVAYSLGNFVSNYGTRRYSDGGVIVSFKLLLDEKKKLSIHHVNYLPVWVYREPKQNGLFNYYVIPTFDHENMTLFNASDNDQMEIFIKDTRSLYDEENINVPEYKK